MHFLLDFSSEIMKEKLVANSAKRARRSVLILPVPGSVFWLDKSVTDYRYIQVPSVLLLDATAVDQVNISSWFSSISSDSHMDDPLQALP